MNKTASILGLAALASAICASASIAGTVAPAPLLGAGLPGLAVLAVAGGGYLAVRIFRRRGE
jgi:predicted acylesterase/phospholipase RssA